MNREFEETEIGGAFTDSRVFLPEIAQAGKDGTQNRNNAVDREGQFKLPLLELLGIQSNTHDVRSPIEPMKGEDSSKPPQECKDDPLTTDFMDSIRHIQRQEKIDDKFQALARKVGERCLNDPTYYEKLRAKFNAMGIEFHVDKDGTTFTRSFDEGMGVRIGERTSNYSLYVPFNGKITATHNVISEVVPLEGLDNHTDPGLAAGQIFGQHTPFNIHLDINHNETIHPGNAHAVA